MELTKKVETHCKGGAAGGAASSGLIGSYVDLSQHIDFKNSECLNESDTHTFRVRSYRLHSILPLLRHSVLNLFVVLQLVCSSTTCL